MTVSRLGLDLHKIFPFELDEFQLQAIAALDSGRSTVVCAPTGSGKTLVGEYVIHRALARNKRVFYTTPLKALSNQKFRDFREQFGTDSVGLLTGDISINRDAPIVVMTTEIFRNMLYGTPIGEVGTSLIGVEAVVLDECHYMNDRQRGTVWEESIIYCPPEMLLVALSATVANSDQLTDWIHKVHGPTELIFSDYRPVPLQFNFCSPKGLYPLLDDTLKAINPKLKPKGGRGATRGNRGKVPKQDGTTLAFTLTQLQRRQMLPAIYFIFSRKGCDKAVEEASHLPLDFLTETEARAMRAQVQAFCDRAPEAVRTHQVAALLKGVAAHHAGILPAWKSLIEELFQQGLIKVVFATETLAAGINMPARTTVISNLSKRTDEGHRLLTASEFLQMAGRAGRRGMDTQGYVVTLQTAFEGAREAAYLATVGAEPLVSQFAPSYGMVLNLLQRHTLEEAHALVERSFGQYLATLHLKPQADAIAALEAEYAQLQAQLEAVDWKQLAHYEKLQERLKEEQRLLKILRDQAEEEENRELVKTVPYLVPGTCLGLKGGPYLKLELKSEVPLPAVLVTKVPGAGQFPYLICLGKNNRWYVLNVTEVTQIRSDLPLLDAVDDLFPPTDMTLKPGQSRRGDEITEAIVAQVPDLYPLEETAPEIYAQMKRTEAVEAQIATHPVHEWGNRAQLKKRQKRVGSIERDLKDRREKYEAQTQRHWEEFLSLIRILQQFDAVDDLEPTELGEATAAIRGDNELWLGMALMSGEFDDLDPQHLAAACAALVTDMSRPDSWTRYRVSPEVEDRLASLRSVRRRLFQLQRRHDLMFPIWMEIELVGLVEQWALGVEWTDLCANTSLDEGDVVRILRRTLDFLSQIPHVPHVPEELKANARRAMQLIDRFPVNEGVE